MNKRLTIFISIALHIVLLIALIKIPVAMIANADLKEPGGVIMIKPTRMPAFMYKQLVPVSIKPFSIPATPLGKGERSAAPKFNAKPVAPQVDSQKPELQTNSLKPADQTAAMQSQIPATPAAALKPAEPGKTEQKLRFNMSEIAKQMKIFHPTADAMASNKNITDIPFGDPRGIPGFSGDGVAASVGGAYFDAHGYDITPWAKRVVYQVKRNWIVPGIGEYGFKGRVGVYLVINREGKITMMYVRDSSNLESYDRAAYNALQFSSPFPPLPDDFPNPELAAMFVFQYN